ncbi:hypothetical protein Q757_00845 [Oenococcus alcoholitolerans]|uniref:Short-chain dehydrogenase n=1 Tax=Oenococcus alcoholitolerans TaxID=931074 RepID=A0ABR4XSJ9_9LACO|nr:hypothetical protein Q757_00845 [Oenococcus alcoholitolerans]
MQSLMKEEKLLSLKDKVFIITGASSGIGAATAKLLAEKDAKVVIGARRQEPLEKIAAGAKAGNVLYKKPTSPIFSK